MKYNHPAVKLLKMLDKVKHNKRKYLFKHMLN